MEKEIDFSKYTLHSVDKVLVVLELFLEEEELGSADVAAKMGINRSAAFRFLTTLEARGFLTRTSKAKYRLGVKLFSLGQLAYSRMDIFKFSQTHMERLMEKTGETVLLSVFDGRSKSIYIDRVVSKAALRIDVKIGESHSAHTTSSGKAMLAYQSESIIKQYIANVSFEPLTRNTIMNGETLMRELTRVREAGYSIDNEESELGLFCYGAPIIDENSNAVAAISVSGPVARMKIEPEKKIAYLMDAAKKISGLLS